MTRRKALYWITITLLIAAAFLPYVWNRSMGYRVSSTIGDFSSAVLWFMALAVILIRFKEYKGLRRWWPVITGPIALMPAVTTIFTFVIWKLRGFAP